MLLFMLRVNLHVTMIVLLEVVYLCSHRCWVFWHELCASCFSVIFFFFSAFLWLLPSCNHHLSFWIPTYYWLCISSCHVLAIKICNQTCNLSLWMPRVHIKLVKISDVYLILWHIGSVPTPITTSIISGCKHL